MPATSVVDPLSTDAIAGSGILVCEIGAKCSLELVPVAPVGSAGMDQLTLVDERLSSRPFGCSGQLPRKVLTDSSSMPGV